MALAIRFTTRPLPQANSGFTHGWSATGHLQLRMWCTFTSQYKDLPIHRSREAMSLPDQLLTNFLTNSTLTSRYEPNSIAKKILKPKSSWLLQQVFGGGYHSALTATILLQIHSTSAAVCQTLALLTWVGQMFHGRPYIEKETIIKQMYYLFGCEEPWGPKIGMDVRSYTRYQSIIKLVLKHV